VELILKCYFSVVRPNDVGLPMPADILLISCAPLRVCGTKELISLKPQARKRAKKDPAISRVKNRD
jgi:hypothetical protein